VPPDELVVPAGDLLDLAQVEWAADGLPADRPETLRRCFKAGLPPSNQDYACARFCHGLGDSSPIPRLAR